MEKQKDEKIAQVNLPHDIITEDFEVKTIPQSFYLFDHLLQVIT